MNIVEGEGLPDFCMLEDVDENAFYDLLAERFSNKKLYTVIGEQVVSVNPFERDESLYSKETEEQYYNKYMYEVAPHIYALGDDTYRLLTQTKENQCVLITGESGAGKTEASKIFMQYISSVSKSSANADAIKDKLLKSNPVLEAFGNAKTLRNDNSSRFGKYMEIQFDAVGAPMGGNIRQYLLEKSRVVTRAIGERSFHIFYFLLSQPNLLEPLHLTDNADFYNYLRCSECTTVDSIDDAREMREVLDAMQTLGWAEAEMSNVWRILAAILHLGNIEFSVASQAGNVESVDIVNNDVLATAAELLQVDAYMLGTAITNRSIKTGARKRNSIIVVPLNKAQAEYTRDSLAKALYDRLFTWVVECINDNIESFGPVEIVIGVLDIYGFEIFDNNSFEQFCINYCNEKLQQLFIKLVLKQEQEEYIREGIEWHEIDYFNNGPIVDLVEMKGGLISLMDEAGIVGQCSPEDLLKKFDDNLGSHPHYDSYMLSQNRAIHPDAFRINHYAGEVDYEIEHFLDKNKDTFFADLANTVQSSTNPLISVLFPEPTEKEKNSKKRPVTAGTQFKTAVQLLINTLEQSTPHYIRCIKSNDSKRGWTLDEERVRHQIRYLNLVETVRVRKAGFCNRQPYERFLQRYKMISDETWPIWEGTPGDGVQCVLNAIGIPDEDYRRGNTKIFIRRAQTLFDIEQARAEHLPKVVIMVQSRWRGYITRYHLERARAATKIQSNYRGFKARQLFAMVVAAVLVQKTWRGYQSRVQFEKTKEELIAAREAMLLRIRRNCAANCIRFYYRIRLAIIRKSVAILGEGYIHWKEKEYFLKLIDVFGDAANSPPNYGKGREFPQPWHRYPDADQHIRNIWLVWWGRTKVLALTQEERLAMRQKVVAMDLFSGNKPWNCARSFDADYLSVDENPKMAVFANAVQELFQTYGDSEILYADDCSKINPKGKSQTRTIIVTNLNIYKYDAKKYTIKKVGTPLSEVDKIWVSTQVDGYVVVKCKPPYRDIVLDVNTLAGEERVSEFVTVLYEVMLRVRDDPVEIVFGDTTTYNNSREDGKPGAYMTLHARVNPKPTEDDTCVWQKSKNKNEFLILYNV